MDNDDVLNTARYKPLEGILDERQRRLYAAEAKVLGNGGAKRVWNATGVARGSILAGLKELEQVLQEQQGPVTTKISSKWCSVLPTTLGSGMSAKLSIYFSKPDFSIYASHHKEGQ